MTMAINLNTPEIQAAREKFKQDHVEKKLVLKNTLSPLKSVNDHLLIKANKNSQPQN